MIDFANTLIDVFHLLCSVYALFTTEKGLMANGVNIDLDKQCFGYAAVFGLITDLKLTQSEFSWCSSIFFLGTLVS